MAKRYVAIEKEATVQNRTERWSNVYLYETNASDAAAYEGLVDAVIAAERPVHATIVTFRRARVYSTSGLNGLGDSGDMFYVKEVNLAGTAVVSSAPIYHECAFLIKWPLPRKVGLLGALGRQRSLKKWIHPCSSLGVPSAQMTGATATSFANAPMLQTYATAVENPVGAAQLIAPDGTEPNDTPKLHPYLEHRQFPRGRKEID